MFDYRILVTGSRDWDDEDTLRTVLNNHVRGIQLPITLISGACPTGADRMAEEWAAYEAYDIDLHPADWHRLGKRAGFIRNSEMVALKPDYCFGFIRADSKGATMTCDLAINQGIPTFIVRKED